MRVSDNDSLIHLFKQTESFVESRHVPVLPRCLSFNTNRLNYRHICFLKNMSNIDSVRGFLPKSGQPVLLIWVSSPKEASCLSHETFQVRFYNQPDSAVFQRECATGSEPSCGLKMRKKQQKSEALGLIQGRNPHKNPKQARSALCGWQKTSF